MQDLLDGHPEPAFDDAPRPMALVVRALSVLSALARSPQGLTLQQLHVELGVPLGSMHRVLATLSHERFVSRSASTRKYVLGSASRALGQAASYDEYLVPPPAVVIELARRTGETVFLTQLVDSRVVCVSLIDSVHRLRLYVRTGQELPMHAAASARIILAYREPHLARTLLDSQPRESFTPATPLDILPLLARLDGVRARGYEVCDSELDVDVWAVAAPVFDASGRVQFGLTLAAASSRLSSPEDRERAITRVRDAAATLSAERGYHRPERS